MNDNRCVMCGEIIPEGRQVCTKCEEEVYMQREVEMVIKIPKEMETDFRLFTVTHGGSIEKVTCNVKEYKHKKCGKCKYLDTSDKSSIGYKCICKKDWKSDTACRRQLSTPACKCFEEKEVEE